MPVHRMKQHMIAMDVYARQTVPVGCVNTDGNCPYWASIGECETTLPFMIESCPLACRYCEHVDAYQRCQRVVQQHRLGKKVVAKSLEPWRAALALNGENVVDGVTKDPENEWVYRLDGFYAPEELRYARDLANSREWIRTEEATGYDLDAVFDMKSLTDYTLHHRIRQNMTHSYCPMSECLQSDMFKALVGRLMLKLGLGAVVYFENPVHFVRLGPGESFGQHHDFRIHDGWKAGGFRVLTVYVGLEGTQEIGFPDLDWSIVAVKENQILVWPNSRTHDLNERNPNLSSELLAPESGSTTTGILFHLKQYPYNEALPEECH